LGCFQAEQPLLLKPGVWIPFGLFLACGQALQHALGPNTSFHPSHWVLSFSRSFRKVRACAGVSHCGWFCFVHLVLHASTFLRPLAPDGFPPFSATTDALTSAGRLLGPLRLEHRTCPVRKFTAYRNNGSCHSVSNHVMCASGIFFRHRFFSSLSAGFGLGLLYRPSLLQSMGSWAQGFAYPWHARPSHPTESSSFRGPHGTPVLRTGISFPVALHGRAFPAAVSFHYRLVDFSLTGTCTPLRCYFHSRTTALLTELGLQASLVNEPLLATMRNAVIKAGKMWVQLSRHPDADILD